MGPRNLSHALTRCAAPLFVAGAAFAAQVAAPTRTEIEGHRLSVYSERVARFLSDYAARPAAVQQRAEQALEKRKAVGSGVAWSPNAEMLYFAGRQLLDEEGEGGESEEARELQSLAAALDLVVTPGVFAARDDGLGEALTVYVRPIVPIALKKDVALSLEWITPNAGQVHARREPIGPDATREGGFEMYLRAPVSKAGTWQLFGVASRDESGAVAGLVPAIAVDCVADLEARAERALAAREGEPAGRAYLRRLFVLLRDFGLRTTPSAGAARLLTSIEGWTNDAAPADVPVPTEIAFSDASGGEHWLWSVRPSYAPRGTLLLLAPQNESVDTVFARSLGEKWLALARARELRVCATHVPYDLRGVAPLLERERARAGGELIVVARGDTFARLGAALQGREQLPLDALVISGVIASTPPQELFPGVERLLVAPGASAAKVTAPGLTWIEGGWIPLLNEPRLPELVATWLATREAARKGPR